MSILANFALELVTGLVPQLGLQKFTAFTHLGGGATMAQDSR